MRVLVIRTNGREEVHEIARALAVSAINRLIGADTFDAVNLRDGRVMLCDDNGWETQFVDHGEGRFECKPIRPRKPINPAATALYHAVCAPGTTHQIAGDVAIALDEDFA
jgi:hypothetical protein